VLGTKLHVLLHLITPAGHGEKRTRSATIRALNVDGVTPVGLPCVKTDKSRRSSSFCSVGVIDKERRKVLERPDVGPFGLSPIPRMRMVSIIRSRSGLNFSSVFVGTFLFED